MTFSAIPSISRSFIVLLAHDCANEFSCASEWERGKTPCRRAELGCVMGRPVYFFPFPQASPLSYLTYLLGISVKREGSYSATSERALVLSIFTTTEERGRMLPEFEREYEEGRNKEPAGRTETVRDTHPRVAKIEIFLGLHHFLNACQA